jgi:hypothetical protein
VDVSDCPYGGLSADLSWPTACGLEAATEEMIAWQNQYDEYIWLASKEQGVPPKVLKSLIEIESQFWPGNSRFYLDEYGLGQINQLGVDVLLRNDPAVYQRFCSTILLNCSTPYTSLEPAQQALVRGAVVQSVDATCETCPYGLDLNVAKDSIALIASLLKSNCAFVDKSLSDQIDDSDYEDLWRYTFATYHGGISCFQDAVNTVKKGDGLLTWENLEDELKCGETDDYVNGLMDNLFAFDYYLHQSNDIVNVAAAPTIVATRTPVPTPTVYISTAVVKVQVYVDRNGNGSPDEDEWINGMSVLLTTTANQQITKRTENGVAEFDMTGYQPGLGVTVSLPGLYRSEDFILPKQGEVVITFKFDQPTLPTVIP